jgi:hypothetical protein
MTMKEVSLIMGGISITVGINMRGHIHDRWRNTYLHMIEG